MACKCVQARSLIKHEKLGKDQRIYAEVTTTSCFMVNDNNLPHSNTVCSKLKLLITFHYKSLKMVLIKFEVDRIKSVREVC